MPIPEDQRPDSESFTPLHPECLSAPEVERKLAGLRERAHAALAAVASARTERPAKFCAAASAAFLALAYVGSYVTALGLFYHVAVGSLVLPAVAKALLQYPAVQCFAETVFKREQPEAGEKTDSVIAVKKEIAESEEEAKPAQYLTNLQTSLAETLNQGSAYLSSVIQQQQEAAAAAAASQTPASSADSAACQHHHDDEEDMKEYLPQSTEETDKILEEADQDEERRRRRNESTGKEVRNVITYSRRHSRSCGVPRQNS